jgi:hypothetical protein
MQFLLLLPELPTPTIAGYWIVASTNAVPVLFGVPGRSGPGRVRHRLSRSNDASKAGFRLGQLTRL